MGKIEKHWRAMRTPGIFLSHPGTTTISSRWWPPAAVSTWSAIKSRDWSEYVIPYVPMLMPLLTPTVPNWYPKISELTREAFTCWPRPRRCLLQLVYLEMELQLGKVKHCIWVSFLPAKKRHIRALEERNRDEKLTIQLLRRPWPCWSHCLSWPHL